MKRNESDMNDNHVYEPYIREAQINGSYGYQSLLQGAKD